MIKFYFHGVKEWCNNLKGQGIKFYILSNTNKKQKVEKVANELNVTYSMFAKKPFKKGFMQAKKSLKLESNKIAVVRRPNTYRRNRCKQSKNVFNTYKTNR